MATPYQKARDLIITAYNKNVNGYMTKSKIAEMDAKGNILGISGLLTWLASDVKSTSSFKGPDGPGRRMGDISKWEQTLINSVSALAPRASANQGDNSGWNFNGGTNSVDNERDSNGPTVGQLNGAIQGIVNNVAGTIVAGVNNTRSNASTQQPNPYAANDAAHSSDPFAGYTAEQIAAFVGGVNGTTAPNPYAANDAAHFPDSTSGSGSSSSSGSGSGGGTNNPGSVVAPSTAASTPEAPANRFFTLVKTADDPHVYILNNRGERFHVTAELADTMRAGGSWYEPDVISSADMNAKNLRYQVNTLSDVETINNGTYVGNYMLIKGSAGPGPDNNVLAGNGNAVYAVGTDGQKFHVTEAAWNQLVASNGGTPPAVGTVTQTSVDSNTVGGAMIVNSAGAINLSTNIADDQALASVNNPALTPAAPITNPVLAAAVAATDTVLGGAGAAPAASDPAPAPEPPADDPLSVNMSGEGVNDFTLIKGAAGSYGTGNFEGDYLKGNSNAVYALNSKGQKFHITASLADKMKADGVWQSHPIQEWNQADVDAKPNGSGVSLTNMAQLRSINLGTAQEYRLVKGSAGGLEDSQLEGNGNAVYAINSAGERYHVTAGLSQKLGSNFANVETLSQHEVDSMGTFKGSISTVKEFNSAIKDRSGHASGYGGDNSDLMPGGAPIIQGYNNQ